MSGVASWSHGTVFVRSNEPSGHFFVVPGFALNGTTLQTIPSSTVDSCRLACQVEELCFFYSLSTSAACATYSGIVTAVGASASVAEVGMRITIARAASTGNTTLALPTECTNACSEFIAA